MPNLHSICADHPVRASASRPRRGFSVVRLVMQAIALRYQRKRLTRLTDEQLHDIGLTRDQAIAEAARPVWDVPAGWKM